MRGRVVVVAGFAVVVVRRVVVVGLTVVDVVARRVVVVRGLVVVGPDVVDEFGPGVVGPGVLGVVAPGTVTIVDDDAGGQSAARVAADPAAPGSTRATATAAPSKAAAATRRKLTAVIVGLPHLARYASRPRPQTSLPAMAGRWRLLMATTAVGLALAPSAAGAATTTTVTVTAAIDGHAVRGSTDRHPVRVRPTRLARIDITVRNRGARALDVSFVRVEGRVLGLTLMAFDTEVGMRVPARGTGVRHFDVDVSEAGNQAVGIIPGSVRVLDRHHHAVGAEPLVLDVRGSPFSVYGLFGVGVAVVTLISFVGALAALARGRLSPNRWWRATRFLTVGFGVGLTLVYGLSAARIWAPQPARSGIVLAASAIVLFALGYITPTPSVDEPAKPPPT